jgi:hypothetical protein
METLTQTRSLTKAAQQSLCLLFTLGGFFPVCSIILHCLGILPLYQCLFFLVTPLIISFILLGVKFPAVGKTVITGFIAGIISVLLYDLSRVPYMLAGWSDFIPKIGGWITNSEERNAFLGYTWRYIGNGGGMGIAFFMLISQLKDRRNLVLKGMLFGLFIFSGLMMVLFFFEHTQDMMFRITPVSFTGSITGHIIYGLSLGYLAKRSFRGSVQ